MRRRISWLVVATTSAVILAFVIPLGLLVRALAEDRAMAAASDEAHGVAVLVAGLGPGPQLRDLVRLVDARSVGATSVLLPGGEVLGSPATEAGAQLARARKGEAFTVVDDDGGHVLVPVVTSQGTSVVRTTVAPGELHRGVVAAWVTLGVLGLVLLLLVLLVADRLGLRVSRPIRRVAQVAHRLREGDLDARADLWGPPEVRELAAALNQLAERIGELLKAEREAVADLSHRLRTPVTALRLDADSVHDPELAERLRAHVEHLQRTVDAVVTGARRPVHHQLGRGCDATAVVDDRVRFWSALAEDQGRHLEAEMPSTPLPAALDAAELRDVVDVLIDNVFAHTPEGAGMQVRLGRGPGDQVFLRVTDDGPGPAAGWRVERGRSGAGSTGLGLDIVRRAARAAGGSVDLGRSGSGGASVTVWLSGTTAPTASAR